LIKRFHALYVGQIELDNIGIEGTPANDRCLFERRLSEAFWAARDVAQTMDSSATTAVDRRAHFQREGYECLHLIQLAFGSPPRPAAQIQAVPSTSADVASDPSR